jgi:hypothetical protein
MVGYAQHLGGDALVVGALYAAIPLGTTVGLLCYSRLVPPARRPRLIPAMALVSLSALVPIAADPGLGTVLALLFVAGFGGAFQVGLNAAFVQAVPAAIRARAFGVAASGLQAAQGMTIAVSGALADHLAPPLVVGACGLVGAAAALLTVARWPRS